MPAYSIFTPVFWQNFCLTLAATLASALVMSQLCKPLLPTLKPTTVAPLPAASLDWPPPGTQHCPWQGTPPTITLQEDFQALIACLTAAQPHPWRQLVLQAQGRQVRATLTLQAAQ